MGNSEDLVEYQAANESYLHYDNLSWSIGGVLVAGSLISAAALLTNETPLSEPLVFGLVFQIAILSIWYFYISRFRQYIAIKLLSIWKLEKKLGFDQNLIFAPPNDPKILGPRAQILDLCIYLLVCAAMIGAMLVENLSNGVVCIIATISAIAVIVITCVVNCNISRTVNACLEEWRRINIDV